MGTVLTLEGEAVDGTPVHRLPLPPALPGRVSPTFNGNGQYRLPHPGTGKLTSYTRASTVAKALDDTYMLDMWQRRMLLIGMQRSLNLQADLEQLITEYEADGGDRLKTAKNLRAPLNSLAEEAGVRGGTALSAEFGTAVHAWAEWIDLGYGHLNSVPEMFRQWVTAHRRAMADAGIIPAPGWTERVVLNTQYGIAGTLDRLFFDAKNVLTLGDVKTSRSMEFSWLAFCIQMAIYHGSSHVLSMDGKTWEPMPELHPMVALISHIPREEPDTACIVPLDMEFGRTALHTAVTVRRMRSAADKRAQNVRYTVGSEDRFETRRRAARFRIETSCTAEEMSALWEEYRDVWTDAHTELAQTTLQLATANAHAK